MNLLGVLLGFGGELSLLITRLSHSARRWFKLWDALNCWYTHDIGYLPWYHFCWISWENTKNAINSLYDINGRMCIHRCGVRRLWIPQVRCFYLLHLPPQSNPPWVWDSWANACRTMLLTSWLCVWEMAICNPIKPLEVGRSLPPLQDGHQIFVGRTGLKWVKHMPMQCQLKTLMTRGLANIWP